jgi:hypothetical protein
MKNSDQINEMEMRQSKAYSSSLISFSVVLSLLIVLLLEVVKQIAY